jgi:hypothetical protein
MNQTLFCRLNEMKQKQNNQRYETFCIEFLSNLEDDPHKRKKHSNKCHKCVRQRVFEKCFPQKKCVWQSVFQ